ncbi:hypothetical protein ABQZ08_17130 [Xanthomonas hortorum pv. hederae]
MFAALLNQLFHRKPHPDAFAKRFQQALRVQGYRGELGPVNTNGPSD